MARGQGSLTDLLVVEHVSRQKLFLREGYRVLQPGGCFCFNAPNRFNIFGPEPHVNLWGVGFMPRRWMPAYVRLFKGMDYTDKRLPSYRELRRMLHPGLYGSGAVRHDRPQHQLRGRPDAG